MRQWKLTEPSNSFLVLGKSLYFEKKKKRKHTHTHKEKPTNPQTCETKLKAKDIKVQGLEINFVCFYFNIVCSLYSM